MWEVPMMMGVMTGTTVAREMGVVREMGVERMRLAVMGIRRRMMAQATERLADTVPVGEGMEAYARNNSLELISPCTQAGPC